MAVNNFSKEWVAGDRVDVTVAMLLDLPSGAPGSQKSAVIRKKGFDELARVAKVMSFFRKRLWSRTKKRDEKKF
jgi:hypothetical protein